MCSDYEASSMIMEITLMVWPIQTERTTQTSHTYLLYMVNVIMLSFHLPLDSPPKTTDRVQTIIFPIITFLNQLCHRYGLKAPTHPCSDQLNQTKITCQ